MTASTIPHPPIVSRDQWLDDKDGHELFPRLAETISEQLGHPVKF